MQKPPPVADLRAELAAFAGDVAQAVAAAEPDWHWRAGGEEWSLTEVMCHLRDVEREVHQPRFRALLREDNAFLPGAVSDEWVEERRYRNQDGRRALAQFLAARRETVKMLEEVEGTLWQRQGQHAFFGPTTMHELLNLAVQHDRAHWEQINNLLQSHEARG